MTYSISQTDPASLSTEEILDEIASFATLAAEVVDRWASLLKVLAERRVSHPMFAHPVMQFWKSITDKSLAPEAAVLLADRSKGKMIRAVLPLPRFEQIEVAEGKEISVARLDEDGTLNIEHMPIMRMPSETIDRVFGPRGIRDVQAQEIILRQAARVQKIGAVTVNKEEGIFKIGNQKLTPEDIRPALLELGYSLVLARDVPADAS